MQRLIIVFFVMGLVVTAAASAQPTAADGDPATTDRLSVEDPVLGAVTISQARFPSQVSRVVLATTNSFADSLAAAPLLTSAPLLLTPSQALPDTVQAEITRILRDRGEVLILGGTAAISQSIHDDLASTYSVTRLAGPDRIGTAIAIVRWITDRTGAGQVIALARAFGVGSAGWADAITASAWAADTGTPILLTPTEALDARVAELLTALGTQTTIVLGGDAAISDAVSDQVPDPRRVAGPDRAATAAEVAHSLWGPTAGYLVINGYVDTGWAVGLPAAGLGADLDNPLLLADAATLPEPTTGRVGLGCGTGPPQIETILVGSPALLSDDLIARIDLQDGGDCPARPVQLTGDGLSMLPLGTPGEQAIATLTDALGQPSHISEERYPFCETSGRGRGRIYEWVNLTIHINDPTADVFGPNPGNGQPYFWGGLYGGFDFDDDFNPSNRPDPWGFTTDRGIGLFATNVEIAAAYPDGTFHPGYPDDFPPPTWELGGQLYGYTSTNEDSGTLDTLLFGRGCGE